MSLHYLLKETIGYLRRLGGYQTFPSTDTALDTLFEIFIFCPKIQLWYLERNCRIVLGENSWKCCSFGLFSCWQLWFHEKNLSKTFLVKNVKLLGFCQNWIFGRNFDFSNSVQNNYRLHSSPANSSTSDFDSTVTTPHTRSILDFEHEMSRISRSWCWVGFPLENLSLSSAKPWELRLVPYALSQCFETEGFFSIITQPQPERKFQKTKQKSKHKTDETRNYFKFWLRILILRSKMEK